MKRLAGFFHYVQFQLFIWFVALKKIYLPDNFFLKITITVLENKNFIFG